MTYLTHADRPAATNVTATETAPPRDAVILASGLLARIRPATAADRDDLEALHRSLSPTSVRHRYFAPRRPENELVKALAMPRERGDNRLATLGTIRARPVAFGYYVITEPGVCGRAELGMIVADRLHGLGIGKALFRELALSARDDGVAVLDVQVASDNAAAIGAFRGAGIPHRSRSARGVVEMTFDLTLGDRRLDR